MIYYIQILPLHQFIVEIHYSISFQYIFPMYDSIVQFHCIIPLYPDNMQIYISVICIFIHCLQYFPIIFSIIPYRSNKML